MRLIKPGITGLAQIKLNYDGTFAEGSYGEALRGFFAGLDVDGEDRMFANKLLFDLSYSAILENPIEWLKTDVEIVVKTPLVMVLGKGQ